MTLPDLKMLHEQLLTGAAITEKLDVLASLRLEIFQEFPYLYQGERRNELAYLHTYSEKEDACVILSYHDDKVIGAVTGMPLIHEDPQMCAAFTATDFSLAGIYYVGELLFRPGYRGAGLGQKLLAQLEAYLQRSRGKYQYLTCATIERGTDHPLQPSDYIPISRFLARTGFTRLPDVATHFEWTEVDGVKRDHPMIFWIKKLTP